MSDTFRLGFSSLHNEVTLDHLPTTGTIPFWLEGSLLRNGPDQFEVGQRPVEHWFDGLAGLHCFSFHRGQVSYVNKHLRSPAYQIAKEQGIVNFKTFATDPCRVVFKGAATELAPPLPIGDNANVNITRLGERFVALTEVPLPIEFDPQTLETLGIVHFADQLPAGPTTAHPHYDTTDRMGINYVARLAQESSYNVYSIKDGQTQRTLIGSVPVQEPAYMHSFGLSERYVILVEFPFVVNPQKLLTSKLAFIKNYVWKPEQGVRFLLMSRQDGRVVGTFHSEAFFAYHHINAFEEADAVVVDIVAYPDTALTDILSMDYLLSPDHRTFFAGEFRRYRLPRDGSPVTYERLSEEQIELPRINYAHYNTKDYQFAYGVSVHKGRSHDFWNQLVKVDVQTRQTRIWFQESCYPGEPVFVEAPGATREDEGVILSVVLNANKGNSFLLILDAASFQEIGRAEVPHHIPFGIHGIYAPMHS